MKGSLSFDPQSYAYGPATEAVRSILAEWIEIDWFEPTAGPDDHAVRLFLEHQRLAHAHDTELFPRAVNVRTVTGTPTEFTACCTRVRGESPPWDWKYKVLKRLSQQHAKARNWSPETHLERFPIRAPRPGDLFFPFTDGTGKTQVLWNSFLPKISGLDARPRDDFGGSVRFYIGYAHGDALDCIKWQLAEGNSDLSGNPFLPLLLCYSAGAYPFSLDRENVVLFRFRPESQLVRRS